MRIHFTRVTTLAAVLVAVVLVGCAGPNDFPPRPADTPTPIAPTVLSGDAPQSGGTPSSGGGSQSDVIVSTVAPPAPPTGDTGSSGGSGVVSATTVSGPPPVMTAPPTPEGNPATTLTISQADIGGTITLAVGQTFLLNLGPDNVTWTVDFDNPDVVSRMKDVTLPEGAEGYFTAIKPGSALLSATGSINCKPGEMCPALAMLFQVTIVVQ